jgi:hypothetical protein
MTEHDENDPSVPWPDGHSPPPRWRSSACNPGLWEHSVTTQNEKINEAMAKAQQQMASMPPEKRKQMEAMMAQHGVAMGAPGQAMAVKVCITPEQAARDEMPAREGKCKQTRTERSGNTLRFAFTCEDGSSGEGEYTLQSAEGPHRQDDHQQPCATARPNAWTCSTAAAGSPPTAAPSSRSPRL